jgi:Uma2 family endonuclease
MVGEHVGHQRRLSMPVFHAFRDDRPRSEKWELIDGRPTMMPPPTLIHQRICRNVSTLLNTQLALVKPEWQADGEVGLLLRLDEKYNPEPDVTVIDTAIGSTQIYADRFYAVVEVLSPDDKDWVLDAKIGYHQGHEHCLAVMFIEQTSVACRLWRRDGEAWNQTSITAPAGRIDLPVIGDIGALADLYRHTPLWPGSV